MNSALPMQKLLRNARCCSDGSLSRISDTMFGVESAAPETIRKFFLVRKYSNLKANHAH